MARLLSPRPLFALTAITGLIVFGLAIAGQEKLALAAVGLAVTTLAGLVWSVYRRTYDALKSTSPKDKEATRLTAALQASDRRHIAALEALRRDLHDQLRPTSE